MVIFIQKPMLYGSVSHASDIARLAAILVALNTHDVPVYIQYVVLSLLIPAVGIRQAASFFNELNKAIDVSRKKTISSPIELENGVMAQDDNAVSEAGRNCCKMTETYVIKHEISCNLMLTTIALAGNFAQAYLVVTELKDNAHPVITAQITVLVITLIKFFMDCCMILIVKEKRREALKPEARYAALSSGMTIIAACLFFSSSNEIVQLSGLILEALISFSTARNSYKIVDQTARFLASDTQTWMSFYNPTPESEIRQSLLPAPGDTK